MVRPNLHRLILAITLVIAGAAGGWGEELVTGQLEIRGAVLRVSPARQDIDPGRPTVVHTALGDLRPNQVPTGLWVIGDLSGPGLEQPLRLTTVPGDPFRIPGLNREGTYQLSGIRLMDGSRVVSSAVPDTAEIVVHRLVISSITSRALTRDEMDAYGIVIDDDNYTAWHYTVGFQIEGGTFEVPFNLMVGPQGITLLDSPDAYALNVPRPDLPELHVPTVNSGSLEPIPSTTLNLPAHDSEILNSTPIPGFIIIPTDIAFLNQFFSVIMVVQNGALAGSGLELRDLMGVLELSSDGVRQAETNPPTIPGESVPVLDPGPDGIPGTSDDLTFIIAQASGQATWLLEGLREGQHRLNAHLTGAIHGLASGQPALIEGNIPGVVVVRDPRFSLTFFHPNVVRTGEYYDFRVSVANTSTTPVYDLSMELPTNAISGAVLAPSEDGTGYATDPVQHVPELLPGTTGMVTWKLKSQRTGRVVASAFNSSNAIDARFVFEIGIGELGIPLSPESIVLPPAVDALPDAVVQPALELLGLAHSLANAPNGVEVDLPPVGENTVMLRGTELAAAGQRHAFGEPIDRTVVGFGLEWMGSARWSSSFDVLRRRSRRGHELENATAYHLGLRMEEIGDNAALAELEELGISGRPMLLVYAGGAGFDGGARLALVGSVSGRKTIGQRADVDFFSRNLDGAAILGVDSNVWAGEVGVIAVPLNEDGGWFEQGYQVQLWGIGQGSVDFEIVIVMPDGSTRRFTPPEPVETRNGSLATIDVGPALNSAVLWLDTDGDGFNLGWKEIAVEVGNPPPASVIAARFEDTINPVRGGPYRNVVLLLSQPVDGAALGSMVPEDWLIESNLEIPSPGGGSETFTRDRRGRSFRLQLDPRIFTATFAVPLNPHAALRLSSGSSPLPLVGGGLLEIIDRPISVGEGLESGVVRGVVLGPDGGPLAYAGVELYEMVEFCHAIDGCSWLQSLSDRVQADAAGGFLFDAVRFRDQTIPNQQAAFMVRAVDPETGHETRLAARLPGDNTTRSLTLAMVGRGDVVGTLRRADGSPLGNPVVTARSITNPTEGAQVVPDVSGAFRLRDLPVGPIQILAKDGDAYTFATAQITGPGAEATVDLVLQVFNQPLASVDGRVIDGATAEPVPGLDIYVIPSGFQGPTHVATSDGEGRFSMTGVPPGVGRFKAWNPALGRYVAEAVADLLGDTTTTVEMVIRPGETGSIIGTVKLVVSGAEVPVAGGYVVAREQGLFTITDGDGRYELANLPLGQIDLEVWDPETGASTTRTVDLTADGQVLVLDFVLREDQGGGSVTVNVADADGVPEVGADVALVRFGGGYDGRTGGDGSVRVEGVPPGKHDVLVRLNKRLARGQVQVLYPGHAASINIVLGGLARAKVWATGDQTGGGTVVVRTPISYRVPGVTSTGRIGGVPEEGWTECELDENSICWIEDLPTNVGSLIAAATSGFYGPVTVSKYIDHVGEHELVINFQAPGVIGGRVVRSGPDGPVAVEGAIVELWVEGPSWGLIPQSQYTTLSEGVFLFELVKRGSFSLRVYHPSLGVTWLNGTIGSGQVINDLELSLRGRAAIEGEVALCYDKSLAKAGSQVRVTLRPANVPRPFISDLEIADLADGILDVTLGEDERASFMFADRMIGGWTLTATSALHGSAYEPVILGPAGETTVVGEPLCLHPTGSVSGLVSYAENGDPAASVTVQLFRDSDYLTTDSTDDYGVYSFSDIPVGRYYHVRAYDAATNRGGISAVARLCDTSDSGYGVNCSRDAVLDVVLSPMGRLEGVLRDHDQLPVASAHVILRTSVVVNQTGQVQSFQREWTTFTSPDGSFAFDGVPAGTAVLTAFAPISPLFVEESVQVDPVSSPITSVDLRLPPTAGVSVRVLDPFGGSVEGIDPVVVFRQSSTHYFREPSGSMPTIEHLAIGATPSFAGVVADRFNVGACLGDCSSSAVGEILGHQFTTALGAGSELFMSNPPQDQVVELELVGRAAVSVTVTRDGQPLEGAEVRITGSGFYGPREVISTTGEDGTVGPIAGLGVGTYDVSASKREGLNTTGGSTEVAILQSDHGSVIDAVVSAESVASADGRVLDPTGSPSAGALVNLHTGGRVFQAVSGDDGLFDFPALPANATYTLEAYAANGLGRHTLRGIVVGTDLLHLGDFVLDELNPWVSSTVPANGFQGADTDVDVVIDFSERMRYATLTGGSIRLREQGSGAVVPTNRTIEDQPDPDGDGPLQAFTRVTVSHSPLASERLYLIDVLKPVEDLAGRSPAFDYHATFRTRDTIPPRVLGESPDDDPDGVTPVGPDVVPIVSCSESMDPESVTDSTVQLLDSGGQPVETILDLQRDGYDIRIRPTTALQLDTFYTVTVDGVTDAAGLPLSQPYTWTFRVRDIEPPVVTLLLPEGAVDQNGVWTALEGREVSVLAAVTSNDALRTVALYVDGVPLVVEPDATPGLFRGVAMMPVGAPSVVLGAAAEDVSGNISEIATRELMVVDDQPPAGMISSDPAEEALPNHVVSITVDAQDDHGLRSAYISTSGVTTQEWTVQLSGTADLENREVRIPPGAVAGTQLLVSCEVEDTLGQRSPLTPLALTISADSAAPVVTVVSPDPGEVFEANDVVSFSFELLDDVAVESTSLEVDGESLEVTLDSVVVPGDSWTAHVAADWVLPEVPDTTDLAWTFTATDFNGNIESVSGSVTVTPFGGIGAPQVAFTCPTAGAFMPTGYDNLILSAQAVDDEGIVRVEFYNGDEEEPFSVHTWTSPRTVRDTTSVPTSLPLTAGPAEMRVRAYDEGGRWREASVTIDVVDAVELDSSGGNDWSALEDRVVYLKSGELLVDEPRTVAGLIVLNGAAITHSQCEPGSETRVDLAVNGPVYVGCGGSIDATGKGYGIGQTYPEESLGGPGHGGSHVGEAAGAWNQTGSPGSTYGSIYRPLECGAGETPINPGTEYRGGGVIRLTAASLQIESTAQVVANSNHSGAGGSIWIDVENGISGAGIVEAGSSGDGGGGAIALEYGSISQDVLDHTRAFGGGGAGSIYLLSAGDGDSLGQVLIEDAGFNNRQTVLPSLGFGVAGGGSAGPTLVTGLETIQPYFVGYWVEIRDQVTNEIKGVWRVATIEGGDLILEPTGAEQIQVEPDDPWRGIYRFDKVAITTRSIMTSLDPIQTGAVDLQSEVRNVSFEGVETTDVTGRLLHVAFDGPLTISESANFGDVSAAMLTLKSESALLPYSWGTPMDLNIVGDVVLEEGARIDAIGFGYWETFPGDPVRQYQSGGSHLGYGATSSYGTPGSTYGSVTQPLEIGGGGSGTLGGGVVRIRAQNLRLLGDAAVIADGETGSSYSDYGGAGGSVWVSVDGDVVGTGLITANGGGPSWGNTYSGGGGAVSVECQSLDPAVTLKANGFDSRPGGAGTVYIKTGDHDRGDLRVEAGTQSTNVFTSLPGLGYGEAQEGSSGPILETGLLLEIPSYFVGHWVEIRDAADQLKGTWRIGTVNGDSLELVANVSEEIAIVPGDRWQGVYRFDAVTVDRARLTSGDPIVADAVSGVISPHNDSMPAIDLTAVSIAGTDDGFYVTGSEEAVSDPSGIARARVVNPETPAYNWVSLMTDGSFSRVSIDGTAGDVVRLDATDAHPSPLTTAVIVGSLPFNESAPEIHDNLWFEIGAGALPHLVGGPGAVVDAGSSVRLAVTNILTTAVFHTDVSADGSFDLVIDGNVGDEFSLVATDTHPDPLFSDEKIVTLPTLETIFVTLVNSSYVVGEGVGALDIEVVLSAGSSRSVSVGFRTQPGTASTNFDFGQVDTIVTFDPWSTLEVVSIPIVDNIMVENDEVFSIELSNPEWAELGAPSMADVTIVDDDTVTRTAAFSIAVDGGNWLDEPLIVDISNGVASFAGALPSGPDRGDRVTIQGVGDFFISSCADDQTCSLADVFGNAPSDVSGATITAIAPAFNSLAEAVTRLAEPDHLGTGDLVALGLNLELLCYAGPPDTTPVVLGGWTTSVAHRINIIAPTGEELRGPSQRHHGTWTEDTYRLEVYGQPAIVSNVGHLFIDGLQIHCDGGPNDWLVGVDAGPPDDGGGPIRGPVSEAKSASEGLEVSNTIIAVSGRSTEGIYQMGIRSDLPVHVQNSIVYDSTGTAGSLMTGIAGLWVEALNNTVIGGGYGIQAGIGTAVNNLVLDSSISGFSGDFGSASGGNIFTVHNAPTPPPPNPPKNTTGPVVFANPGAGIGSNYHLECSVMSQGPAVTTNFPVGNVWDLQGMFDGDPESVVLTGEEFDTAEIMLDFGEPRAITGTAVELSNAGAHHWMLEAAMTAEELSLGGASYVVLVPEHPVVHTERVYEHVAFESARVFQAIRLTVWRDDGSNNVHIVDWWLDALNPACGQGIDLSLRPGVPIHDDVDGIVRTGSWDIGADQSANLEVGFAGTARWWWESEEEARIEVVLSQPVEDTVAVHYRTHNLDPISAIAGVDYDYVEGQLIFEPGTYSQTIFVPLNNDGSGDEFEVFAIQLFEPEGARLGRDWWEVEIREGQPPPRVRLIETVVNVGEGESEVSLGVELSRPSDVNVFGTWNAFDRTAHIALDYEGPPQFGSGTWAEYFIPTGATAATFSFTILDDDIAETVEGFAARSGWSEQVQPGVPAVAYIRISDDDGVTP